MKCPCHGCEPPKRTPTCHSTCPDYPKWKAWLDGVNREKAKDQTCKDLPSACKKAWWKKLKQCV